MDSPNSPEFKKNWNYLSDNKWKRICVWRHVTITLAVFALLFFARILLLIVVGTLSHYFYEELYDYFARIVLTPISASIIVITACLYANYFYWVHYEKLKDIDIPSDDGKSVVRYKVVHLDDYFPAPYPLRFHNTNHYTGFLFHRIQQIIYVQNPETKEIFGYCRKCHQLMSLEQVQDRQCPHCGNKIYFWGPH